MLAPKLVEFHVVVMEKVTLMDRSKMVKMTSTHNPPVWRQRNASPLASKSFI